ncbi:MAG: 2-amino-4-hydroxy-6-hydroxymethyldihydropteridine diphosphokinase [Flavobacteriales bacterium]
MNEHRMFIGLGGNLGDRSAHLDAALAQLTGAFGSPVGVSPRYETPAWGMPDGTPLFLNQVVAFIAPKGVLPEQILDFLLAVEEKMGRVRNPSVDAYQNRTLDCDLLLFEGHDAPHHSERLTLPHPRLAQRRFVLQPLADIAPKVKVPGWGETVESLLARCTDPSLLTRIPSSFSEQA